MARIGGHLGVGVDTQCSGNVQESMTMILMRADSNEGYGVSLPGHFLSPSKAVSGGTGQHSMEFMAKWGPIEILKQPRVVQRQELLSAK